MIDDDMLDHPFIEPECEVIEDEEERSPEPFTFWDVLRYPISAPGMSIFCVYVFTPLVMYLLLSPLPMAVSNGLFMLNFVILLAVFLSTIWYLTVCIRAGAEGQRRAPNVFEFAQDDSPGTWLREFFLILTTVIFCIGPAFIVRFLCHVESPVVFWSVLGLGLFLLPMYLLSVVMFDCVAALNPFLVISSVFSTFLRYLGVAILFAVPMVLTIGTVIASFFNRNPFLDVVIRAAGCYLLIVAAGMLGWFFYKNEEKLRWDV